MTDYSAFDKTHWENTTGEDALANLSIEKTESGTIVGHVRIRSKTQGIALSLGDRITMCEYPLPIAERAIHLVLIRVATAQRDCKPPI